MNGKQFDICGVCGGDNSTCQHFEGVVSPRLSHGERYVLNVLPVGAYNIQYWFPFGHMKKYFLELWNKDDAPVIADYLNGVFDDRTKPITFGGVTWYFYYGNQFLYTKGPLTEPAIIKLFKNGSRSDHGIHYAYSVPLSVSSCSGNCGSQGTWNSSLCACSCGTGKYGPICSSKCNTYCLNDAPLDEPTCTCQCNSHQGAPTCHCRPGYEGRDCAQCVTVLQCQNGGTFNSNTCHCDCSTGHSGTHCEHVDTPDTIFG